MAKSDIIVSPAKIWVSPVGEALPDETTVAAGAAWGGNWTDLGYTLEAVSMNLETETFDLMVQQSIAPLRTIRVAMNATIETVLAELSGANLSMVLGATKSTTSAGASQKGFDSITVDGEKTDVSLYQFGIEGVRVHSSNARLPVRVFLPQASIVMNGAIEFSKDAGAGIPVQIKALADTNGDILIVHNVTSPASS